MCFRAISGSSASDGEDGAEFEVEDLLLGNDVVLGVDATGFVHIMPCTRSDTP